jgi:hypothetical protein
MMFNRIVVTLAMLALVAMMVWSCAGLARG